MTNTLRCTTVMIKFIDKLGLPDQEVRAGQADAAKLLMVSRDSQFLTVDYMTDQNFSIKQINYNLSEVKEYACQGVMNPALYQQKLVVPVGTNISDMTLNTWKGAK